jgi:hypothetical protein
MEERAQYGPWKERPRLTVVHDAGSSYSALPHDIVFSDLTDGEVRIYAVVQSYAWGDGGECTASHATLAARTGKKERTIRALLASLVAKGYLIERHHGRGQGKAYRPCVPPQSGRNLPVSEPKRQKSASQAAEICQPKRQISATPIEEDEVKKILEELPPTEVGVADAPQPATAGKPKRSAQRKTACPETFPLDARHLAYGAELGLSVQRVRAETDKFLAHHRFKGTLGLDWYAGWQNWMRRAVLYAAQPASNGQRNGASQERPMGKPANVRRFHVGGGNPNADA